MTRDEAKKLLPIIQAYADGKDVQYKSNLDGSWKNSRELFFDIGLEWRIKPEPMECWVVVGRDGDLVAYTSKAGADHHASFASFSPYTIHHMREVED